MFVNRARILRLKYGDRLEIKETTHNCYDERNKRGIDN